ncbi:MAG: type II toxin-antitoxin system VapC family toxin [Betaproteobacteria bacterium]|nr:type II toxin-antitoxin system VapC family toxin [Betaproteobacteria bacterium]
MKLLLDTRAFLWAAIDPDRLSPAARGALCDPGNTVAVSAVSFWEVALKTALGKLTLSGTDPEGLIDAALAQGFDLLPLDPGPAARFHRLPTHPQHRDPFNRMLAWQALAEGYTLVSRDRQLTRAPPDGLRVLW